MSKTITEAVSELSQGMSHLELHWENQRLKHRIHELQADLYEGNCELEKQQRINRELANGPYVIANSPQMVKDYIDAGAVTDGMVVIIQSKLKEVSDE